MTAGHVHYVEAVPAQMRTGLDWYKGSADAVYQNLNIITDEEPEQTFVFGADHVYRMDVRQMLNFHLANNADCTVAAIPVPIEEAHDFGIIDVGPNGEMRNFLEKPKNPPPMPGNPKMCLASMGNYLFKTEPLVRGIVRRVSRVCEVVSLDTRLTKFQLGESPTSRPSLNTIVRVRRTLLNSDRSWLTSSTVPPNNSTACSSCSIAGMSRWFVGSSSTRQFEPFAISSASTSRVRSPGDNDSAGRLTCSAPIPNLASRVRASGTSMPVAAMNARLDDTGRAR